MTACVYRHYDVWDRLLYVGLASDAGVRFNQHRYSSAWAGIVGRITVDQYGTRAEAAAAEKRAIEDESPPYNRRNVKFRRVTVDVAKTPKSSPERVKVDAVPAVSTGELVADIRLALSRASVGDVHKLTGIPLRTLHRFKSTGVVPKYQTIMALTKWAEKK